MYYTPYATEAILLKDLSYLCLVRKVNAVDIDFCAVDVVLRWIFGQTIFGDLGHSLESSGLRIVVVVDGDNFVFPSRLQNMYDVRA